MRNTKTAQEIATPMIAPVSTLVILIVSTNITQTSQRYVPWLRGANVKVWNQGGRTERRSADSSGGQVKGDLPSIGIRATVVIDGLRKRKSGIGVRACACFVTPAFVGKVI